MIFLTGQRASGKSRTGAALAKKLGLPHIDMDVELEISFGKSISAYVAAAGWPAFREREGKLLARLIQAATPMVVSTGGGVILAEENRRLLCNAPLTVYLNAPADTLMNRRLQDPQPERRPPLQAIQATQASQARQEDQAIQDGQAIQEGQANQTNQALQTSQDGQAPQPLQEGQDLLLEIEGAIAERDELYRSCAHLVLDATRPTDELVEEIIGQVALAILRLLNNAPPKKAKK